MNLQRFDNILFELRKSVKDLEKAIKMVNQTAKEEEQKIQRALFIAKRELNYAVADAITDLNKYQKELQCQHK